MYLLVKVPPFVRIGAEEVDFTNQLIKYFDDSDRSRRNVCVEIDHMLSESYTDKIQQAMTVDMRYVAFRGPFLRYTTEEDGITYFYFEITPRDNKVFDHALFDLTKVRFAWAIYSEEKDEIMMVHLFITPLSSSQKSK